MTVKKRREAGKKNKLKDLELENVTLKNKVTQLTTQIFALEQNKYGANKTTKTILALIEEKQDEVDALVKTVTSQAEVTHKLAEKFKVVRRELCVEIAQQLLTEAQREIAIACFPGAPEEAYIKYASNMLALQQENRL